jgi:WD40 repeat protein
MMSAYQDHIVKLYKDSQVSVDSSAFRVEASKPHCLAVSEGLCVVGGKDFPLQAYDLTTQQPTWKAWVLSIANIREKVNDLRCVFSTPQSVTVTTAYNQIRSYDLRAGRKPVKSTQLNTPGTQYALALVSLHLSPSCDYFVGDTVGHVYKLNADLQLLRKVKDKGNGAVRDVSSNGELMFTASLDRSLRVYDYDTLELQRKVQLWQKLNCLALLA